MSENCLGIIKSDPSLQVPGFTPSEIAKAVCRVVDFNGRSDIARAVVEVRSTRWPGLSKAVDGGLEHVVSVDNAAGYAELWHRGDNWYAVTGAEMPGQPKLSKADTCDVYMVPAIKKGDHLEVATARFLGALFGAPMKKGGCNCSGK